MPVPDVDSSDQAPTPSTSKASDQAPNHEQSSPPPTPSTSKDNTANNRKDEEHNSEGGDRYKFGCQECGKCFTRNYNLERHLFQ